MSLSSPHHIIIEDDVLSLGSSGDLSFVAGPMDDFFSGLDSPTFGMSPCPSPPQSPKPFSLSQPLQSSPPKATLGPSSTASSTAASMQYPRMVSVDSMSQVTASPRRKASKATPMQSLLELVNKKQQQKQTELSKAGLKRAASSLLRRSPSSPECRIASVFQKPSLVLRQILDEKSSQQEHKKRKLETSSTALHEACRRSNVTVGEIEEMLAHDPTAAIRPAELFTQKRQYNAVTGKVQDVQAKETYRYPLNLAIQYQASPQVLERLVAAAPGVLTITEGPSKQTPLHVLLQHKPTDDATVDMMLLKHPDVCSIRDAKDNTPLHQAVAHGASAQMVRHLVVLAPGAVLQRNFHHQTPLNLAQRGGGVCSTEVVDYLWSQVQDQF